MFDSTVPWGDWPGALYSHRGEESASPTRKASLTGMAGTEFQQGGTEPVLVAIDERLEKRAAHQREDGGVGANAERQRQHHRERKPSGSSQRAECNFQIVDE